MSLTPTQIERSFWYHDPESGFPPEYISYPEEYQGGEYLNLVCTQLDLSSSKQKKLNEAWCALLPELSEVKILWFNSRVTQPLFEAACEMKNLEGLYVKWSGIENIASLQKLKGLKYLNIGSSTKVESIEPLRKMKGLHTLAIENFKQISDLEPIADLTQLEGLSICGSTWTTQRVNSLEPLTKLKNLKYLYLINLRAKDKTLRHIGEIKSLVTLRTAWWWKAEEFEYLRESLPNLKHGNPLEENAIKEFAKK